MTHAALTARALWWLEYTQRWERLNECPDENAQHIRHVEQQLSLLGYRRVGNDWQPINRWIGEEADHEKKQAQPQI